MLGSGDELGISDGGGVGVWARAVAGNNEKAIVPMTNAAKRLGALAVERVKFAPPVSLCRSERALPAGERGLSSWLACRLPHNAGSGNRRGP